MKPRKHNHLHDYDFAVFYGLCLLIFIGLRLTLGTCRVTGSSMAPTLQDGQFLLLDRVSYHWRAPRPGEVILFRSPQTRYHYPQHPFPLVKRVVALQTRLATSDVYVLGDNRAPGASIDSRHFGAVPRAHIHGRAIYSLWPPPTWGLISRTPATPTPPPAN